ncbi:hypothetical protein ABZ714_34315 [Streptomyces sp. NPDC006798]|uniref:hypothetical protein n=1 Tax=unclassified Streptomyces TaxID=2593676 RepID=UPI00331EA191
MSAVRTRTEITLTIPVAGVPDLAAPVTGRTVVPTEVEIRLTETSTIDGVEAYAIVSVSGPRRLKSGDTGRRITSAGWERFKADQRPGWLTGLLAAHWPKGWARGLAGLPVLPAESAARLRTILARPAETPAGGAL